MRRSFRPLALAACLAALAVPVSALAGPPRLLGNVQNGLPTVTAGPDGAFHTVFNDQASNLYVYCRITPDSIGGKGALCTQRTAIAFNDDGGSFSGSPGKAWIVADEPGTLRLVLAQYVSGKTYQWLSTDGGVSFTGPTLLSDPDHGTDSHRPLLVDGGSRLLTPSYNTGAFVASVATNGSEAMVERMKATLADGGLGSLFYNLDLGASAAGIVATADNLARVAYWRLPPGAPANDGAAWGAPIVVTRGGDSSSHAGGGSHWLGYTTGPAGNARLELRRWNGAGFGAPRLVERTNGYLANVYVAANGVPGVAYRRNGTGLRFAQLAPGAKAFATKTVVRNDDVFHDLVVAHDGAGRGVAVWSRANAVYAADLTEVFDRAAPRESITRSWGGITLGLNIPGGCVRPGAKVSLTTSGQGRMRLTKVRYRLGSASATDHSAPWGVVMNVPAATAPGATIPVRAVMTLRRTVGGQPVGPRETRTLVGSLQACGG